MMRLPIELQWQDQDHWQSFLFLTNLSKNV